MTSEIGIDELTTPEGAAGGMPAAVAVACFAWQAAQSVCSGRRTIAGRARELAFTAAVPDNRAQLSRAAIDFGTASSRPTAPSTLVSCPGKQR
ncbi:hypothetical protein AB0I68_36380 [Streptomyces sp. NPDC050448]|uniref:hypothetical protein n=1 Tax=Streptomyces sp. NPDC050448 TaxID=3155404 RepID=UPI00343720C1